MKASEFRRMESATLETELNKRREELLRLRCQTAMGEELRPHQVRAARRDIARIETVLREKAGAAAGEEATE